MFCSQAVRVLSATVYPADTEGMHKLACYLMRAPVNLSRLRFDKASDLLVCQPRAGRDLDDEALVDPLEFLARVLIHIPQPNKPSTPTLILHGGSDQRVPIGQPMEFYRALKDRGVPVELVFYRREGHGLPEYYHRLDRMQRQYDWIVEHTLGARPTTN